MDNDDVIHADTLPATKGDLKRFATKVDLARFATKADLERFATKADLERFATKVDLARFATKDDLARFTTKAELGATIKRELAVFEVRVDAKLDALAERLEASYERARSEMSLRFDKCLSVTMGVRNGEIILGHRVDELEKRVTRLESKPERSS